MAYYHDLVTQRSWEELKDLTKLVPCVVIGGWAVYIYTKALKSKDIDILVDFDALSVLKRAYDITKNHRLKKYHAAKDGVEMDIYLPHYSAIGIPVEHLMKHAQSVDGFSVLDPDYLFVLKMHALNERGRSTKGRKDFLDIISLYFSKYIDAYRVKNILSRYKQQPSVRLFSRMLHESSSIPELDMNHHAYAKMKNALVKDLL